MIQIGASVPRPYSYISERGLNIPKDAFQLWWETMSDAIFEKLLTGLPIVSGGKLGQFQLCRRSGKHGYGTVYLEHIKSTYAASCRWFYISRHRDHRKNYQVKLLNSIKGDPF